MAKITVVDAEKQDRPVILTGELSAGYDVAQVQRLFSTGFAQVTIAEASVKAKAE